MNKKLDSFKKNITGKSVAVLGMGISNIPLIKYLAKLDVDITAFDSKNQEDMKDVIDAMAACKNVKCITGKDYLNEFEKRKFDYIFKTPVIRNDISELQKAISDGAVLTSEMELFLELCPAKVFGVTGSDGKTTTTTLIYLMLKEAGYNCHLGGNIGTPLLDRIDDISEDDMVVVELSSFQLQTMKISPDVAAITNMAPNHLDVHSSFEEYINAKKNIFKYQNEMGRLVLNYDNIITAGFVDEAVGEVIVFSRLETSLKGTSIVYIRDDDEMAIDYISDDSDSSTSFGSKEQIRIKGEHNVENYLAAIAAVHGFVKYENVITVMKTFEGVEHRNEFVRTINEISFFNDSIASSPDRTKATLNSFDEKVVLIAGGKDKGIPYDSIGETIHNKVKVLVLIGDTSEVIAEAYNRYLIGLDEENKIPIFHCNTYIDAVKIAFRNAKKGDNVVLSPASTSFDMFKNFEERGNIFKKIVQDLVLYP